MPKKTAAPIELPYNDQDDKPPSLEAVTQPLAEAVREYLLAINSSQLAVPGGAADKGKLLVVDDTGAVAFQAMKGDATLAADGTVAIGAKRISTAMLADGLLTTAKYADKSVTEAKLADAVAALLHNERTPLDNSVTPGKLAAESVSRSKISTGSLQTVRQAVEIGKESGQIITLTWPKEWADTSYTAHAILELGLGIAEYGDGLAVQRIEQRTKAQLKVVVRNATASNRNVTIHATGWHD